MLADVLTKVLAASPEGRTVRELRLLLDNASVRTSRTDIVDALDELQRQGLVSLDRAHRWRARPRRSPRQTSAAGYRGSEDGPDATPLVLRAAPARVEQRHESAAPPVDEETPAAEARPPFDALMRYYAATQRADPRGATTQFADRHGVQFQLVRPRGSWWSPESRLVVELADLPDAFREALARRDPDAIALGYPLAVAEKDGVSSLLPVGLLSAGVRRDEGRLELRPRADDIALNPDWVLAAARASPWSKTALEDQFAAATALGVEDFRGRLAECMARQISGRLTPADPASTVDATRAGIHDAVAVFLPNDTSFTRGVARDLDRLASMGAALLEETALHALLHDQAPATTREAVLNPVPLTPDQLRAAETAAAGPVTAITGPPGTGKSQVIVALVASAIADGRSVLFASRNHQAVDAVEDRLARLCPDVGVVMRAGDRDRERDTDFGRAVADIVAAETAPVRSDPTHRLNEAREHARARSRALVDGEETARLHCALSAHVERLGEMASKDAPKRSRASRLLGALRGLFRRRGAPVGELGTVLPPGASAAELEAAIARDRRALSRQKGESDPSAFDEAIEKTAAELLADLVRATCEPDDAAREALHETSKAQTLDGKKTARDLPADVARQVVRFRPVWAVTNLSAPARIPLVPGLFDLVIVDEASQSDIASALPLFARGKRLIVVGDPQQLESIPQLGPAQERALMTGVGLSTRAMAGYAQSLNSLFGFVASRRSSRRVMLRDQFRSAPDVVRFLNVTFYGGKLRAARDPDTLKAPKGHRPGIAWTDVPGQVERDESGGPRNRAEADAIAGHLDELLDRQGFDGTVGVVSPFNAQVALLTDAIAARVSADARDRVKLKVATIDRFQGDERDVILFSPVAAPGAGQSVVQFLQRERRRLNVAISRASAVAHVFGHLTFARQSGIRHLQKLAEHATSPRRPGDRDDRFDSLWERRLYEAMRRRGLDPQPQYPVAGRFLDFALFSAGGVKLDVEVDGRRWHLDPDGERKTDDLLRDRQLRGLGWKVRRFWVHELERDVERCLDLIQRDLASA